MALRGMLCENAERSDSNKGEEHGYRDLERSKTSKIYSEIFCPKCGKGNSEGSNFCIACGASLGSRVEKDNFINDKEFNDRGFNRENIRTDVSYGDNEDELGNLQKHYTFSHRLYIGTGFTFIIGICIFAYAIYLSNDPYVQFASYFGDNSIMTFIWISVICIVVGLFEFMIRKQNYLDIYNEGIRGKGSFGSSVFSIYKLKQFQLGSNEIIRVENKKLGMTAGVHIITRTSEIIVFIHDGDDAVNMLNSLKGSMRRKMQRM